MEIIKNPSIYLKGLRDSWQNFFEVIRERKDPIERRDGKSTGNFWAFMQHLEQQFDELMKKELEPIQIKDTYGKLKVFKDAFYGLTPMDFFLYEFYEDGMEDAEPIKVIAPCSYDSFIHCTQWKSLNHANCPIHIITTNNIEFIDSKNTWNLTVSLLKGENKK